MSWLHERESRATTVNVYVCVCVLELRKTSILPKSFCRYEANEIKTATSYAATERNSKNGNVCNYIESTYVHCAVYVFISFECIRRKSTTTQCSPTWSARRFGLPSSASPFFFITFVWLYVLFAHSVRE